LWNEISFEEIENLAYLEKEGMKSQFLFWSEIPFTLVLHSKKEIEISFHIFLE